MRARPLPVEPSTRLSGAEGIDLLTPSVSRPLCFTMAVVISPFHGLQGLKRERREAASAAKEQRNGRSKGETAMEGLDLHTAE